MYSGGLLEDFLYVLKKGSKRIYKSKKRKIQVLSEPTVRHHVWCLHVACNFCPRPSTYAFLDQKWKKKHLFDICTLFNVKFASALNLYYYHYTNEKNAGMIHEKISEWFSDNTISQRTLTSTVVSFLLNMGHKVLFPLLIANVYIFLSNMID